jgi:hypothetical protein
MSVYFKVSVLLGRGDGIHGGDLLCREDMLWSVDDAMDTRQMGCEWIRYLCTRAEPVTCNLGKTEVLGDCRLRPYSISNNISPIFAVFQILHYLIFFSELR